ncbi:MAG: beta-N-acetylhexosaminidase [Bacillota bacterium]|nr:beta-N-acetylhexosaminidase [Bacillota bacterium]
MEAFANGCSPGDPIGLVMIGFGGSEPTPELEALIRQGLAGVILFARNLVDAAQTAELTASLQACAVEAGHPPLLICTDQEGGRVRRLRRGLTAFPSAMALGAAGDPDQVYGLSSAVARELLSVGINLNLAPCADVNSDPRNPVIGTRSYGGDPFAVGRMVAAAVRGYQDGGVLACAKHFPGHGHTDLDSHLTLPVIDRGLDELRRRELVPFAAAVSAGAAAVMSAHIVVPELGGDVPATLSPRLLTGLLRGELGHDGLILTDCMEMAAVRSFGAGEASTRAVAAGADLVLWSHTPLLQLEAISALRAAAGGFALPPGLVTDRLGRVRRARLGLVSRAKAAEPAEIRSRAEAFLGGSGSGVLERSQRLALAAVTRVGGWPEGAAGCIALPRERSVLLIDLTGLSGTPEEPAPGLHLAAQLCRRGFAVRLAGNVNARASERAGAGHASGSLQQVLPSGDASIVCLTHDACLKPDQAVAYRTVRSSCPGLISVATGLPYDLAWLAEAASGLGLCAYDPGPACMEACAGILCGESPPRGSLPVKLDG